VYFGQVTSTLGSQSGTTFVTIRPWVGRVTEVLRGLGDPDTRDSGNPVGDRARGDV